MIQSESPSRSAVAASSRPTRLIGIEAGMASHHVARELVALGHEVKQAWIPTRSAMQRVLGLTRESQIFLPPAAFHWISGMRRRLRGKENREGSKRSGVALRVGIQAGRKRRAGR